MLREGSRFVDVLENAHSRNPTVQLITRRHVEVGIEAEPSASISDQSHFIRTSPTSQVGGASTLGGVFCLEDGVSVKGDPFVFEEFNVYLARLLPHADAAKEPGDGAVAGVAVGCDPVSICGGEEVIKHSFEYFSRPVAAPPRSIGRRLGCDQLRCFHVAVGGLPALPASNIRILPVCNESGRVIGAKRGDGQS